MIDYAAIIKQAVPMRDAVARYTGEQIVLNRIRCPIHHGADRNMRIYNRSYYCWVCHASGDVIQFVQSVLGVSFQDAMKRLNDDFNIELPICTESSGTNRANLSDLNRKIARREFEERMAQIDTELVGLRLANLSGLLYLVELVCDELAPAPWDDEWREDWCEAMRVKTVLRDELI